MIVEDPSSQAMNVEGGASNAPASSSTPEAASPRSGNRDHERPDAAPALVDVLERRRFPSRRTVGLVLGASLVLTALFFAVDPAVSNATLAVAGRDTTLFRILNAPHLLFEWPAFVVVFALVALKPERLRLVGFCALATGFTVVVIHILKFAVGRARPQCELGAYSFHGLGGDSLANLDGFPSGHAAAAVLLAFLADRAIPGTGRILAPFVVLEALSRVAKGRHYVSDLIAAAVLTWLCILAAEVVIDRFIGWRAGRAT